MPWMEKEQQCVSVCEQEMDRNSVCMKEMCENIWYIVV